MAGAVLDAIRLSNRATVHAGTSPRMFRKLMNAGQRHTLGQKLGADAIEQRLAEIALLMRHAQPHCNWTSEQQFDRPYTYRLIVQVNGREAPLRFTSRELLTYSRTRRRAAIDRRMHEALSKLLYD